MKRRKFLQLSALTVPAAAVAPAIAKTVAESYGEDTLSEMNRIVLKSAERAANPPIAINGGLTYYDVDYDTHLITKTVHGTTKQYRDKFTAG